MFSPLRGFRFVVLVVLVSGLAVMAGGCGKKGPLYLPDDAAPRPPPTAPPPVR